MGSLDQKIRDVRNSSFVEDKHSLYNSNGATMLSNDGNISKKFRIDSGKNAESKDTFENSNATSQFKRKSSVHNEIFKNLLKMFKINFKKMLLILVLYVLLLNCGFVKARPNLEQNGLDSGDQEIVRKKKYIIKKIKIKKKTFFKSDNSKVIGATRFKFTLRSSYAFTRLHSVHRKLA